MPNSNVIHLRNHQQNNPRKAGYIPMDFYSFKHRTFVAGPAGSRERWLAPHWVVGHSPFDDVLTGEEGHVVHIGNPQFVARWSYQDDELQKIRSGQHWLDDQLGLLIYEVCWVDGEPPVDWASWLLEACCAVAYAKGDIAERVVGEGTA